MPEQNPADGPNASNDPTVSIAREDLSPTVATPKSELPSATPADEPAAAPAGQPNAVGTALGTVLAVIVQTWKGNTVGALQAAASTKNFGWVATGAYAVIGGLLMATMLTRLLGGFDDFADYAFSSLTGGYGSSSGYFSVTFGAWFAAFILGIILSGLFFILRAVCIKWVFSTRGAPQPFTATLALVSGAYAIPMALVLLAAVLNMIPNLTLLALVSLASAVLALPVGLIPEIMIYIGINRTHRFTKSPLIPHVMFTLLWAFMLFLAFLFVTSIYGEILG